MLKAMIDDLTSNKPAASLSMLAGLFAGNTAPNSGSMDSRVIAQGCIFNVWHLSYFAGPNGGCFASRRAVDGRLRGIWFLCVERVLNDLDHAK